MAKLLNKWLQVLVLASSLIFCTSGWTEEIETVRPGYGAVMADVFVARPLGVIGTVLGSVVFVVTLPITAVTGTIGEAGTTLVVEPAITTFVRCLGCDETGWRGLPKSAD